MNFADSRHINTIRICGGVSFLIGIGLTWTPYYPGSPAVHGIAGFFLGCSLPLYIIAFLAGKKQGSA